MFTMGIVRDRRQRMTCGFGSIRVRGMVCFLDVSSGGRSYVCMHMRIRQDRFAGAIESYAASIA